MKRKSILFILIIIATIFLVNIHFSFSFFSTRIAGSPKEVSVNTKNIIIQFQDSTDYIMESNLNNSWTIVKTFTVTNNTSSLNEYSIVLKNIINTYESNSIQYKMECTSNNYSSSYFTNMTNYVNINQVLQSSDYLLGYRILIDANVTQTFTLSFRYNPSATVEKGPIIQGTISIIPGDSNNYLVSSLVTKGSNIVGNSISVKSGNSVSLLLNKIGYDFSYATISGSGCTFDADRENILVSNVSGNTTCSVTGTSPIQYNIVYAANGGSGSMSNTICTYDKNCTLRNNAYTRTGYEFIGWKAPDNKIYSNGDIVKNLIAASESTINLTAQWSPIEYKVAYNCNKKTGEMQASTHQYGASKNLNNSTCPQFGLIIPGLNGKIEVFTGWSTNPSATTPIYSNAQSVLNLSSIANSTIKLYAVYSNLFTYDGLYEIYFEQGQNWKFKLYGDSSTRSGAYTITFATAIIVDMFLVGGGGGGGIASDYTQGGGGGGGYTKTYIEVPLAATSYTTVIGAGGTANNDGQDTTFDSSYIASGGYAGTISIGGNGGSGGGDYAGNSGLTSIGGTGGSNGGDGAGVNIGHGQISEPGPLGETGNTSEFGEITTFPNLIYSGGGGGYGNGPGGIGGGGPNTGWSTGNPGTPNTGGGAGSGYSSSGTVNAIGGSGVIVIRNHR